MHAYTGIYGNRNTTEGQLVTCINHLASIVKIYNKNCVVRYLAPYNYMYRLSITINSQMQYIYYIYYNSLKMVLQGSWNNGYMDINSEMSRIDLNRI